MRLSALCPRTGYFAIFLLAFAISSHAASAPVTVSGSRPQLIFACELDREPLVALFSDPSVIVGLQALHAGVSLALKDLSPQRAQIVRTLNAAQIPLYAWLTLPADEGYYLNADNASQAAARFAEFEKWSAAENLHWAGVGLDVEPGLSEYGDLLNGHKAALFGRVLKRLFDGARLRRARESYAILIRQIESQGLVVQTYQLPFLADERKVHSTVLERAAGIVDVRGDQEVLMLYSSFNHAVSGAMVWSFGQEAQLIAVGSTARSGDAAADAKFPPLNWDEFSRDLIIASHFSKIVGIYSLEGCVQQGFLSRLQTMDWSREVSIPATAIRSVTHFRHAVESALWLASHFFYFVAAFVLLLFWWLRRRRSARSPASAVATAHASSPQS